jgi:hypothetical protein
MSRLLFLGYVQSADMNDSCLREFQLQNISQNAAQLLQNSPIGFKVNIQPNGAV